jgi:hypothetical protein
VFGELALEEILGIQTGCVPKRRDAEVPELRPFAELWAERDANEWAGESAEKYASSAEFVG